ncbi:MAG: pantoate kinase, partial [Candidatus Heimdallarchaeota archaeon]
MFDEAMNAKCSSSWGVPTHVSGLFQIFENKDPLLMGSRGAGFSINNPVITKITATEASRNSIEVYYNKEKIDGKVSRKVAISLKEHWTGHKLLIEHTCQLPIQGGFGTSGAGALGTAFALNELFSLQKSDIELGQIAHIAEVKCNTGLGDVISQLHAFAEIRTKPGAPGIGEIKKLDWPLDYYVLCAYFGTLSTKDIITDPEQIERINSAAEPLLAELDENPNIHEFLHLCYKFATKSKLLSGKTKKLVNDLHLKGYSASMIMLGDSIFVVGSFEQINKCYFHIISAMPDA